MSVSLQLQRLFRAPTLHFATLQRASKALRLHSSVSPLSSAPLDLQTSIPAYRCACDAPRGLQTSVLPRPYSFSAHPELPEPHTFSLQVCTSAASLQRPIPRYLHVATPTSSLHTLMPPSLQRRHLVGAVKLKHAGYLRQRTTRQRNNLALYSSVQISSPGVRPTARCPKQPFGDAQIWSKSNLRRTKVARMRLAAKTSAAIVG